MSPADIVRVANVGDPQISPDGEWIVYTVATSAGDNTQSALWITRVAERTAIPTEQIANQPRVTERLLPSAWNATSPRWSPDSQRIAFLSLHDGQSGVWTITIKDRQARFLAPVGETNFFITYSGESIAWSPDARRIAFVSATTEGYQDAVEAPSKRNDPRTIERIQYKSRTSFSDEARTHVWVTDVDRPEPRQLTNGPFYDHAITWSPKGDEIAFLSNHEPDPDANNNSDIFAVDLQGRVRQITQTRGCEYEPAWSPDGKWIAYTATKREVTTIDSVAEDTHIWVVDAGGGPGRELTSEQDRRARDPQWSPDSRAIYYMAGDHGRTSIYRIPIRGGRVQELHFRVPVSLAPWFQMRSDFDSDTGPAETPEENVRAFGSFQIGGFSVASKFPTPLEETPIEERRGRIRAFTPQMALTISGASHPGEVWLTGPGFLRLSRRISGHNDAFLNSFSLVDPQEFSFKSFDGTPIQAWLMKPAGFREDRRYPLILSIHGGPHGMYGYGFNPTLQAYAAHGYAVLFMNPRGSAGYGQKFSDGTIGEWGGGDYRDLMAGLDAALRRHTWIDQYRVGVTGISYGGFMTDWIVTQTSRFKAAVSLAGVSDLISFYSISLYQDLIHAEFGYPWDDYDLLWRWSPLRYAKQAQTPTLFIHGEQDNDVHITQSEEMYMALKRRGIETVFVRYPREGHVFHEPRHRVDATERTLAWFDRYLK
jgi:dipeptidyl aminopeptidase/acylaminoacyl peptidase